MRITCIDFETANSFIGSVCSLGIASYEDGELVNSYNWLVRPHEDYFYFDSFNTMIHGISYEDVEDAPEFDEIYQILLPLLKGSILAAHNAAFDISVLRHVLDLYQLEYPEIEYICTYKIAQKVWSGFDNYKLNTICNHLNFSFKHHNSEQDAIACGRVLISAMNDSKVSCVYELTNIIGMRVGKLHSNGYSPCSTAKLGVKPTSIVPKTDEFNCEHEFYHKKVVFTGILSSMLRKEAMQKVVNVGGDIADNLTEDTDFLVMGIQDYNKFADGKESNKTKKAKKLIKEGKELQIIDEDTFLKLLA